MYAEIQLGWALISATIPCLKGFVDTLSSGYLGANFQRSVGTDLGYTRSSDSCNMNTIGGSERTQSKVKAGRQGSMSTLASTRGLNDNGFGGLDFGIRRTTGYNVRYERRDDVMEGTSSPKPIMD